VHNLGTFLIKQAGCFDDMDNETCSHWITHFTKYPNTYPIIWNNKINTFSHAVKSKQNHIDVVDDQSKGMIKQMHK